MRRRIQLLVIGITALVLLCAAIPLAVLIRSTVGDRAEQAALDRANDVARSIRFSSSDTTAITNYLNSLDSSSLQTSVTLPDGTVLGDPPPQSDGAATGLPYPDAAAPTRPTRPPGGDPGGGARPGGQAQLYPAESGQVAVTSVPTADGNYLVQVYLSDDERYSGVYGWWALLAAGALVLLLFGAGVAELFTRRIVRPLSDAATTADRIAAGDLTARAPVSGPREIAAVGQALNSLADRIDELIAEERETVADLSHRLRTPLTALRLDAESLENKGESERISGDVMSIERTLTAVIRAARRPQREGRIASSDLAAVTAERAEFWSALAEDQARARAIALPEHPVFVRASAEDLAAAVDALLENVIAHTPEGTGYAITLATGQAVSGVAEASLSIADDGPGLPDDAAIRGRSDRGSTGLGLDIARRAAEAGGGRMELGRSPSGGAQVTLHFVLAAVV